MAHPINRATPFRGGDVANMSEEFRAYGLSESVMKLVGGAKLALAALLVVGIWVPSLAAPSAALMAILMVGAIAMHVRVGDPPKRSLPALAMLVMSVIVVIAYG